MQLLDQFAFELPAIQIVRLHDREYVARRKIYNSAVKTKPPAFAVPKTAEEVAAIVKFAGQTGANISVRCGGHGGFGRALVEDGIVIDIRALNDVTVNKASGTAVIGGGVQSQKLSKVLGEHDCLTPCPNTDSVGYVGYATTGGYGQMAHKFGLGIDHFLSAKIVDADGNIVEADEDVMKATRGACGNFGIVVEATIKIYPFSQILTGPIIFESSDYRTSMYKVQDGMQALATSGDHPPELDFQPIYGFDPNGAFYGGIFMWAGPDINRGRQYLDKITSFHQVIMTNVGTTNMTKSQESTRSLVPEVSYCDSRTVNVRRMTPKIYEILVNACATLPKDPAAMLTWHEVKACSPSSNPETSLPSVYNVRESHFLIEILSHAVYEKNYLALSEWGLALRDEIIREAPEEILDPIWLASIPPTESWPLEKLYGQENADFLRKLKQKKDPRGIFKHAVPNLLMGYPENGVNVTG